MTQFGVETAGETCLASQIFKIGGIDIDRLPLGKTTIYEKQAHAVEQFAINTREKFLQ